MNVENKKISQFILPHGFAGRIMLISMNRFHKSIYENVAKVLELRPEDDFLEIACGNGYFINNYASHVHSATGLDLSELCIKLATRNNRKRVAEGSVKFVRGDATQLLPWEDSRFSSVAAMASFLLFPEPLESLKEMYRVLRPGGRAVTTLEWNAEDGKDHLKEIKKYNLKVRTEDDVRNMFKDSGFTDITINYAKGMMTAKMMIARGSKP
jgi:ubiquinone/menaquinone biosynthesis C-methylase UbiE